MTRDEVASETINTTRLPAGIWALGFVSLLADISSEMVHSLLPLFMVSALGASAFMVGLVEGVGEATALMVKVFSGVLSDYFGRRKPFAIAGTTCASSTALTGGSLQWARSSLSPVLARHFWSYGRNRAGSGWPGCRSSWL